ncbi:Outer membrane lipoprotein SmpA, a component of the essential YaeT outer-membrane protein assembly complex [Bathymodiolus heckerae thiotrophic gill symbiont]|uniref:outer membrane protein assembly factor BamE n=1 Tax=Bathymodiolus heckerae thiotrophic gill symbiont TaxID=1052212 RepID=UPI0010B8BC16|nr:outer membrane protein assembly factor BamE [Bathymodiolus heckerae thiotrophic gill symbiont]SMN12758.1 Outer membrane lipoprotein SmpA, a component of the essential YaeT outer-membrane protein assembly complex [Bathymodiolus heckerae thiotrophic gill symbiont]
MNRLILIVLLSLFLNACVISKHIADTPNLSLSSLLITPYKADIHQGSVLERFTINQLELGMSSNQVQDLIGPPSIIDPFHNNQWDYINHSTLGSGEVISYRLTLTFEKEKLVNINTNGIDSLPQMTAKEKAEENKRINDKIAAIKLAKEKAKIAAEKARVAKEKAKIAAIKLAKEKARVAKEKAQRILQEKIAEEAKIAAIKLAQAEASKKAKAEKVAKDIADAKAKALEEKRIQEKNKPWYKF